MSLALCSRQNKCKKGKKKRELSEEQKQEMKDAFELLIQTKPKP